MSHALLAIFWGLMGAAVGSFLNVVADRLPTGGSLLSPPSHCPHCGTQLRPAELVPVVSYLALRGRCRSCGAPIGRRTLIVEAGTGLLFALAAHRLPPMSLRGWIELILVSMYLGVLVVVTVTDIEHGLILNRVMYPALGIGAVGAVLMGWPEGAYRLAGGAVGAGVILLILLLVPGGMGWGDLRLAGFVGLVTGLPGVLFALFVAFVSGGVVAGALLASGRRRRGDTLPLGPFLALGGTVVLLYGDVLVRAFWALATWV
ncbi:MAG TPA: prepilin peptidase [Thermoflexia bacterium]|nr:prepilin peptidase [Thermoflexia bacterium]